MVVRRWFDADDSLDPRLADVEVAMNWHDRIALGLAACAVLEATVRVYLYWGTAKRAMTVELIALAYVPLLELVPRVGTATGFSSISVWQRWVLHAAAAAVLIVVSITRRWRSFVTIKALEQDIELLDLAIRRRQATTAGSVPKTTTRVAAN
jgi:hypothetical protein